MICTSNVSCIISLNERLTTVQNILEKVKNPKAYWVSRWYRCETKGIKCWTEAPAETEKAVMKQEEGQSLK